MLTLLKKLIFPANFVLKFILQEILTNFVIKRNLQEIAANFLQNILYKTLFATNCMKYLRFYNFVGNNYL